MFPEAVFVEECKVRFLVRQCDAKRQYVARVVRQYVTARLFVQTKPSPCIPLRRQVVLKWLQKRLHRDGLQRGAGDGARTRDSLLGRQDFY